MGVEIEGRLGNNDFRMRKLTQIMKEKDKMITAMLATIEELKLEAQAEEEKFKKRIEKLNETIKTLEGRLKYYRSMRSPKPEVETQRDA